MEDKKFDCWSCEFKGKVPGSAHVCCKHPSNQQANDNPMAKVMSIFASVKRVPPIQAVNKDLNIRGDAHGIKSGWFNYPWNFDPVWLKNCDGYEAKAESSTPSP